MIQLGTGCQRNLSRKMQVKVTSSKEHGVLNKWISQKIIIDSQLSTIFYEVT